jgi:YVTN family beta-propeller protein/VCBS repeat-containing protein
VAAAAVANQPPIVETPAFGTPDPRTGAVAGQIVAKDPEGKKLSYTLGSGPAQGKLVFNTKTGAFTYTPTAPQRVVAGLTPGDDFAQFTVKVSDGTKANIQTVTIDVAINPAPLVDAGSIATGGSTDAIAVTKTRAYVANTPAKTITVIDTVNRTVVTTIQLDEQPVSLDVTPDGKRVYVVDDTTNLIHVIDATNNTVLAPIDFGDSRYPVSVAVSPDGKTLLAPGAVYDARTDTWTTVVTKVATATGKITGTVKLPGSSDVFYDIEFTPNGRKVYVVSDLATEDPEGTPPVGPLQLRHVIERGRQAGHDRDLHHRCRRQPGRYPRLRQ